MGRSGSGKSTLMHCLAGLDRPTSGSVVVAGRALENLTRHASSPSFRREQLGFVFQAFNLLPMLTAEQNIRLPLELAGRRDDGRAGAAPTVTEVLGLTGPADPPARRALRRAAAAGGHRPRTGRPAGPALRRRADRATWTARRPARSSATCAASVRELGQTVVMVTHDLDAAAYADDVVVIADGKVRAQLDAPTLDELTAVLHAEPVGAVR